MTDLLVRLYDLPAVPPRPILAERGIVIRRAMAAERHIVLAWVAEQFGAAWRSEAARAFTRPITTLWIAVQDDAVIGFAAYDCSMRGFFGPTGVDSGARGLGVGEALLFATLRDMRAMEYGYAIIGGVGPEEFYRRWLDVSVIPGSEHGIYRAMLHSPGDGPPDDAA